MVGRDKHRELGELLRFGLEGDEVAYTRFLQQVTPLLRRMVTRRLIAADVEDVVQEILISIHKARHTYDGQRPIVPWLLSIVRYRISDYLRKHYAQRRHQTVSLQEWKELIQDVTEDGIHRESIEALMRCVPEKHRQILTMMHVEGFTAREVGHKMGMNESAIKVAAHRAIKKIQQNFGT
jgi:RNA polymerase sigma-70 factor (ECF subfamily)